MEVLPEGPLASILLLIPIPEGCTVSVVCGCWNRVLRDVVHRSMIRELQLPRAVSDVIVQAITARFQNLASLNLSGCLQVSDVGVQAICAEKIFLLCVIFLGLKSFGTVNRFIIAVNKLIVIIIVPKPFIWSCLCF